MSGEFAGPENDNETAVLTGRAPVAEMQGYQKEFAAYTGGFGRLSFSLGGYDICHNPEEVIERIAYDPDADLENTADSVFCSHGAGTVVPWYESDEKMHIRSGMRPETEEYENERIITARSSRRTIELTREELDAIYVRTPDPVKKRNTGAVTVRAEREEEQRTWTKKSREKKDQYLLVDGYNIIFAWEELRELSEVDMAAARGKLADLLCNYQGYRKCTLILVFDAYKVEGNPGSVEKYHNIHIVYTKEAETADQYIEKTVKKISKNNDVVVATSDALEQVIILGQGARRMSAAGLKEETEYALSELRGEHLNRGETLRNYLFDYLDKNDAEKMEKVRLGHDKKNWPA